LSDNFFSVCHAPLPLLLDEICLDATEVALKARKLETGVFCVNLMHLTIRILKFEILRDYPPYILRLRKVKSLSLVKQTSPKNTSDRIFGNYIGVQEPKKILRILMFVILRVPYKFRLRKVKSLSLVKQISPKNKSDGNFGNMESGTKLQTLNFEILILKGNPYKFRQRKVKP
jgi:hypothetical protein